MAGLLNTGIGLVTHVNHLNQKTPTNMSIDSKIGHELNFSFLSLRNHNSIFELAERVRRLCGLFPSEPVSDVTLSRAASSKNAPLARLLNEVNRSLRISPVGSRGSEILCVIDLILSEHG